MCPVQTVKFSGISLHSSQKQSNPQLKSGLRVQEFVIEVGDLAAQCTVSLFKLNHLGKLLYSTVQICFEVTMSEDVFPFTN